MLAEDALLGSDVDNLAHDAVHRLGLHHLGQLALHGHGEFVDDGGVDTVAADSVVASAFKLVGGLVACGDAEVVSHIHMVAVGDADGEGFCLEDVLRCFVTFADEEGYFVHVTNHAPSGIHYVHAAALVIGGHHQNRHRVHSRYNSKVFFHCSICIIVLRMFDYAE